MTSLRDSYPALQKAGVEVWAVPTDPADGPKGQLAFSKHLKLPLPLLPDPSRKLGLLFGAVQNEEQMAARMSVFIDKKGVVRWIDKQIIPSTYSDDELKALPLNSESDSICSRSLVWRLFSTPLITSRDGADLSVWPVTAHAEIGARVEKIGDKSTV